MKQILNKNITMTEIKNSLTADWDQGSHGVVKPPHIRSSDKWWHRFCIQQQRNGTCHKPGVKIPRHFFNQVLGAQVIFSNVTFSWKFITNYLCYPATADMLISESNLRMLTVRQARNTKIPERTEKGKKIRIWLIF